jgi:hypothetical protein
MNLDRARTAVGSRRRRFWIRRHLQEFRYSKGWVDFRKLKGYKLERFQTNQRKWREAGGPIQEHYNVRFIEERRLGSLYSPPPGYWPPRIKYWKDYSNE